MSPVCPGTTLLNFQLQQEEGLCLTEILRLLSAATFWLRATREPQSKTSLICAWTRKIQSTLLWCRTTTATTPHRPKSVLMAEKLGRPHAMSQFRNKLSLAAIPSSPALVEKRHTTTSCLWAKQTICS